MNKGMSEKEMTYALECVYLGLKEHLEYFEAAGRFEVVINPKQVNTWIKLLKGVLGIEPKRRRKVDRGIGK